MDLPAFQSFVREHAELFAGIHPELPAALDAAELTLGFSLPDTLRWLLREWGYSEVCGIDGLEGAVADTLACRQDIRLPHRYFVLNDWNDGGVVYLDSVTGLVRHTDGVELHDLCAGITPMDGGDTYANFAAWVVSCVETEVGPLPREPGKV
jgi:hypothetical protein